MIKHYRSDYGALNCPVVCRITGDLDVDALRRALDALADRHESLRTTFTGRGPRLSQRIHPPRHEPIATRDLSTHDDPAEAAFKELSQELGTPIDPQEWPVRARLWRIGARDHLFCLNLHHLVTDAWSTGILLRDLCLLFDRETGGEADLPEPGWSPAEFVQWQRSLLAGDRLKRHQDYWRRQLAGARLPVLTDTTVPGRLPADRDSSNLPAHKEGSNLSTDREGGVDQQVGDRRASNGQSTRSPGESNGTPSGGGPPQVAGEGPDEAGAVQAAEGGGGALCDTVDLPTDVVTGLRELARREQTTLFTVLLALFQAQLYRVTGQPDLCVASMFANRTRPELRETVGLLAGMVLLRANVPQQRTFADLVRHCHSAVLGAFTYSELPFQLLPSNLVDTGGGRADDVMFNVMTETQHLRTGGGVHFELVVPTEIGSRFPFELAVVPVGASEMKVALFRAPDRLNAAGGESFLRGFAELASAAARTDDASLTRLLTTPASA
jgi:hypothetical protein